MKIYAVNGTQRYYVDGVQVGSSSITYDMNTQNYTIFGLYYEEYAGFNSCMPAKLYSMKLSKNDTLVYNLIPCYRKSDNVIGMYDLVHNQFYTNVGSEGYFTKGNDVIQTPVKKIKTPSCFFKKYMV